MAQDRAPDRASEATRELSSEPVRAGEPVSTPSLGLAAGSSFARYQIVRCIGAGGMGAVFEATHTLLRKRVALKTLHASLARSENARERFLREAETVARIRHPNVVDITDVGVENGVPFLVMEFLQGEDLASLLQRGRLSSPAAVDTVLPVASGLVAVHRLGIVHRDIKPENVFLSRDAHDNVVPKLVDFGVSKDIAASARSGAPALHTVTGTPHYMSPEQARGSATLDNRTDQYALGVMLYQALSGARPYDADSLLELMHLIDQGEFRPLEQVMPELPPGLAQVVHRAMARHPRDRFETTEAFGKALLPFASERTRFAHERDFDEDARRTLSDASLQSTQEATLRERLSANTVPASVLLASRGGPYSTASGVRVRKALEELDAQAEAKGLPASVGDGQSASFGHLRWLVLGGAVMAAALVSAWLLWGSQASSVERASKPAVGRTSGAAEALPQGSTPAPADAASSTPKAAQEPAANAGTAPVVPAAVPTSASPSGAANGKRLPRRALKPESAPAAETPARPLDIQLSR